SARRRCRSLLSRPEPVSRLFKTFRRIFRADATPRMGALHLPPGHEEPETRASRRTLPRARQSALRRNHVKCQHNRDSRVARRLLFFGRLSRILIFRNKMRCRRTIATATPNRAGPLDGRCRLSPLHAVGFAMSLLANRAAAQGRKRFEGLPRQRMFFGAFRPWTTGSF